MGLTKEQKAGRRQARILQRISEPGGSTSGRLAKELKVGRGIIINDIRNLRCKGYPIQVSDISSFLCGYKDEVSKYPSSSSIK